MRIVGVDEIDLDLLRHQLEVAAGACVDEVEARGTLWPFTRRAVPSNSRGLDARYERCAC